MNWFFCCGLGLLLWSSAPAMGADTVEVAYDRNQDRIGIRATDVTLAQIFAQLAQEAGIESEIDATAAGDRLSMDQPQRPTVEVLQHLLRRYSYILHYRTDTKIRRQLGAVTILGPAGKAGSGAYLPPVQHSSAKWRDAVGAGPFDMVAGDARGMAGVLGGTDASVVVQAPLVTQPAPSAGSVSDHGIVAVTGSPTTVHASAAAGAATGGPAPVPAPATPAGRIGSDGSFID